MDFADWLKGELDRRGWSMADLATMVGVARSTVSRWLNENRIPDVSTCRQIAVVLHVPLDVVLIHAGHQHVPSGNARQAELAARLSTLEHRYGVLMGELEDLEQQMAATRHELAQLEEHTARLETPSEVALAAVRDAALPDETRHDLERRLTLALRKWEPHWMVQQEAPPQVPRPKSGASGNPGRDQTA